ncbi:serine hydrolase domain-containing protein [Candidatus Uabimicrobium amorphum]|uniref:Serine hydrolase n=1 Tax=Uabimicrobium amorphum TaxID=2596890 RepID=A0A5S9ITB1_UABAM|nr:serine hydrolase domain-containing protein [Candidatus Uabimicrobium amorphum]BBM87041.1 serine hydrolase [Candidatus Uabimicrobium amorphum]
MKNFLIFIFSICSIFCQKHDVYQGLSLPRLQKLQSVLSDYIKEKQICGMSVMIARHGKIVHFEQQGVAEVDGHHMQDNTIFRIYSMSKLITSVAVMILHEEAKFQLYDPVSKFIPEFKKLKVFVAKTKDGIQVEDMKREPTIRDLLTHTSGLTYGYFATSPVDKMYVDANILDRNTSLKGFITKLTKFPLKHQPGSKWEYSISTDVLGYLVEVISGQSFDEFLRNRIFTPLEMKDTDFFVPQEKLGRFTALYTMKDKKPQIFDTRQGFFSKQPKFLSGGGGLVSTANDYMNFCTMFLQKGRFKNKQILGRKTVEFMMTNQLSSAQLPFGTNRDMWGYGFGIGGAVVMDSTKANTIISNGSFQWAGAASTFYTIDPKEDLVALLFTQMLPFSNELGEKFRTLVYQTIAE